MSVSTACTGNTVGPVSRQELRVIAFGNFYAAERKSGASPALAFDRAEQFLNDQFDRLVEEVGAIMELS